MLSHRHCHGPAAFHTRLGPHDQSALGPVRLRKVGLFRQEQLDEGEWTSSVVGLSKPRRRREGSLPDAAFGALWQHLRTGALGLWAAFCNPKTSSVAKVSLDAALIAARKYAALVAGFARCVRGCCGQRPAGRAEDWGYRHTSCARPTGSSQRRATDCASDSSPTRDPGSNADLRA